MTHRTIQKWAQNLDDEATGVTHLSGHNKNIVILTDMDDLNAAKQKIEQKGLSLVRLGDHARVIGASIRDVMNDVWCNGNYLMLLASYNAHDSLLVCDNQD